MKKLFAILLLLIGALTMPAYAAADDDNDIDGDVTDLQFNPGQGGGNINPKMPAFRPISGYIHGSEITLYSTVAGEAEIFVIDDAGAVAIYEIADLSGGYTIVLEKSAAYRMICVKIGGRTYGAEL